MRIRTNIKGYIDRRGPRELAAAAALEQARADKALQERFEEGVRRREARRLLGLPSALDQQMTVPGMLRRQA
jgi:hypothetical protein